MKSTFNQILRNVLANNKVGLVVTTAGLVLLTGGVGMSDLEMMAPIALIVVHPFDNAHFFAKETNEMFQSNFF